MVKQLVVEVFSYELVALKPKLFSSQVLTHNYFLVRTYAKIAKKLNFSNRQDAKSAENS
ncbi:hypothetical protein NIES4072_16430 [Nostoc commune NIES-4072]|uniref:Uncharacterized protein n=1 Tax=Nostoc commune NIES-4072 TaxID=2005467 RepID=A0A2R5FQ97_NOSCO|nr:hypothetical protein NIES4070_10380 [Nostoc commune HK-02]GBG17981.1 hypothetical protein NIES4072_16430 [Nostoc commune NIES-4072]